MISEKLQDTYDETLNIFKEPQTYKGVKFYPLLIRDREQIERMNRIFGFPKTYFSQRDPKIFKLSYLKYLLLVIQDSYEGRQKDYDMAQEVEAFLKHVTRSEEVSILVSGDLNDFFKMILQVKIDDVVFSEEEFSDIREIVLEQNGVGLRYIEDYNPELEEDLNFINRKQKQLFDFKDQVFAFAAILGKTIEDIEDCSVYEMKNLLESAANLLMFKMQIIPLTHVGEDYNFIPYMTKLSEQGRYAAILQNVDEFKEKSPYFKSDFEIARKK